MQHDNPNHKLSKNIPLSLFSIKNELKQKCINVNSFLSPLSNEEKVFIHTIKERTKLLNQNNVTRTRAYYQFYKDILKYIGHCLDIWYRGTAVGT